MRNKLYAHSPSDQSAFSRAVLDRHAQMRHRRFAVMPFDSRPLAWLASCSSHDAHT
jgi:hypothetical protein